MEKKSNARKISETPTKVYTYGAFLPENNDQVKLIKDQLYLGNKYRNKLVEIERKRRDRFRNLRQLISPNELKPLENKFNDLENKILSLRKNMGGYVSGSLKVKSPKSERQSSPEAIEILKLQDEKKNINLEIKKIYTNINKIYFQSADDLFSSQKKERILNKAKELGKDNLGPNDPIRHEIVRNLYSEMISSGNRFWAIKAKISQSAERASKRARSNCKCASGVYLEIDKAAKQSFSDSKFEPRFKSFDGTGKIGVQLTKNKGLSITDALDNKNPVLKIELKPEVFLRKNKNKKKVLAIARMKLSGSEKNGSYIDIPFIMHREMPKDSIIKWAFLIVSKIGYRTIYELQFTIESDSFKQIAVNRPNNVAINLGWKINNKTDEILVATIYNGNGVEKINFPAKMRSNLEYKERLLGYAADHFNDVKKELISWVKTANVSDELNKILVNIFHWKSHKKLSYVARKFDEQYLDGSWGDMWKQWKKYCITEQPWKNTNDVDDFFTNFKNVVDYCKKINIIDTNVQMAFYLKLWNEKDIHLINWARSVETKLRRHRREIYRCLAKKLSSMYGKVIVEKWNKSQTAETPNPESDNRTKQEESANAVRQFVGVSVLTDALKQKFGSDFIEEDAKNISKEHVKCGGEIKDQKNSEVIVCSKCLHTVDVNYNAAKHLYDRYCERLGDEKTAVPSRKTSKKMKLLNKMVDI